MQELGHQVSLIRKVAEKVFSGMGASISYKIGTMIEIPRAALVADEVRCEINHRFIYLFILIFWRAISISLQGQYCNRLRFSAFALFC